MARCEICRRKAVKRIAAGDYAIQVCKSCYRIMRKEIERQSVPFTEKTYSGPKGSLLGNMQFHELIEAGLAAEPDALLCLWQYPHDDWALAVSSGITDLPSYRELENRIRTAEEMCEKQGRPVIVIEIGVQNLFDLLASEGLENTSENRTKMICRLGEVAYSHARDESSSSDK